MKKYLAFLLAVAMMCSMLACTTASNDTPAAAAEPAVAEAAAPAEDPADEQLYIFVSCLNNLEFMQNHKKGFEEACRVLGVRGEFFGPDDADLEAMNNAFEQAIAMNPDGIICCPVNDMGAMTAKATEAGIPVAYVDISWAGYDNVCFCGTGNAELGRIGGAYLAELLGGEGQIAELYAAGGGDTLTARIGGYEEIFAQYEGLEVVASGDTNADYEQSTQTAAAILQAHPDLDAFVCLDSTGGTGAATAIKEAGLEGKVHVISLDKDEETLQYIKEGIIDATLAQNTVLMSYYAMYVLYSLNNSVGRLNYTPEMGITPVPTNIDTGTFIIDSSNIDFFLSE